MREDNGNGSGIGQTKRNEAEVGNDIYHLAFAARRSIRYHNKCASFYSHLNCFGLIIAFVSGVSACTMFVIEHQMIGEILTFFAMIINGMDLIFGYSKKNLYHNSMEQRFGDLLAEIQHGDETEANYRKWEAEGTKIDKDRRGKFLRALDVLCHNEEVIYQNNGTVYEIPSKQMRLRYLSSCEGWIPKPHNVIKPSAS